MVNQATGRDAGIPEQPPDAFLVSQSLAGDRKAFDVLIRRYERQAMAVAYRLLSNLADAQEATQNAYLKAYSSLSTLQNPAAFGGWLLRIVSNLSLNFRRARKTRSQLPLDDLLSSGESGAEESGGSEHAGKDIDPLHALASKELGQRLGEAINRLPEKQRLAIVMFTIEELPQKQVAEALECSVEAVKWHVFQGRKKLKELLKDVL